MVRLELCTAELRNDKQANGAWFFEFFEGEIADLVFGFDFGSFFFHFLGLSSMAAGSELKKG